MLSLTTWQRDLLQHLLSTGEPIDAVTLSQQLHLTLRQIRYGLRDIESWLQRRQVVVVNTPRVGIQISCTPEQRQRLLNELLSQDKLQLILTPEQRQQLLALALLVAQEPLILQQLQQDLIVSRSTVLKDLDAIEPWLHSFKLEIARRQHRGCWIEGSEFARRQALAALLWGDIPFDQPLMQVQATPTIVFALANDSALLPIVEQVNNVLSGWGLEEARSYISKAEGELGVWFTVEALTLMSLALALQLQRVNSGQQVDWQPEALRWVQDQVVWPVAADLGIQLWPHLPQTTHKAETAALALQFLGSARDVPWSNKFGANPTFDELINRLMATIANAYAKPQIRHDKMLYDGLDVLLMPAYVRQRFGLWSPNRPSGDTNVELYPVERKVAAQVAAEVLASTGIALSPATLDELVLLLRAALIRAQPERPRHILVVCPSGMATTQLLVAQLKARFVSMGTFEVLPLRELSAERMGKADLLITTVPLSFPDDPPIDVIQVHPMLKSEDIAALTQWLT
jgi:mannitol operon transcriptional antiterminator